MDKADIDGIAAPAGPPGVTPRGLLAVALLGCLVAALFGGSALANWASLVDLPVITPAAQAWDSMTRQLGLDRPYQLLRHAVRAAEAAQFTAAN